jgi:hypothetical protein
MSYVLGFGLSTERRALFAAGVPLVIAAAWAIERLPIVVSISRLAALSALVVSAWAVTSIGLFESTFELRDELIVILPILVLGVVTVATRLPGTSSRWRIAVLIALSLPSLQWLFFNPLQSTTSIFRKPDTSVTRRLDHLAAKRTDGAIAPREIFSGGILNGVGYRSVTHTITTPSPDLFRQLFSGLPEHYYRNEFNRYIQLRTSEVSVLRLRGLDLVLLPVDFISTYATVPDRQRDVPWDRIPALREKHKLD